MLTRIAAVLRRIKAALSDTPPPPSHYRTVALHYAMDCPGATVSQWVDFCTRAQGTAFDEGYFRGVSDGLIGPVVPLMSHGVSGYMLDSIDLDRVVPIQGEVDVEQESRQWNN